MGRCANLRVPRPPSARHLPTSLPEMPVSLLPQGCAPPGMTMHVYVATPSLRWGGCVNLALDLGLLWDLEGHKGRAVGKACARFSAEATMTQLCVSSLGGLGLMLESCLRLSAPAPEAYQDAPSGPSHPTGQGTALLC